jgi:hypothetical protein
MINIFEGSALLQYHLELGRSGMEDGPMSTLSIPERRERLRVYSDAWKDFRWSACIELLPNIKKSDYVMDIAPGGILAFVPRGASPRRADNCKIIFFQIPSNSRGIPMRQWEHPFPPVLHQYALDPSEDILVVLQWDRLVALDPIVPVAHSSLILEVVVNAAYTFSPSPLGNPIL